MNDSETPKACKAVSAPMPQASVRKGDDSPKGFPRSVMARRTFQKITSSLQVLPPRLEEKNVLELGSYFNSSQEVLNNQKPLVQRDFRRHEEHKYIEKLKRGKTRFNTK